MNPFEKPPRPAKTSGLVSNRHTTRLNPFDDGNEDDVTIEFRPQMAEITENNLARTHQTQSFSPISENTAHNKHRPFHAHVQFEPPIAPPRPPRRVFGGSIPLSRDNSEAAVQLRAESRVPPYDSSFTHGGPPPQETRSPFRFMMPSRNAYQPANRASPGPSPRSSDSGYEESSSSSSEEDDDGSEGTASTSNPSSRTSSARSSAGLINSTGIEMQTVPTPPKTHKKGDKNANRNKSTDRSTVDSATEGDTQTKKKKKKRKTRKATVCVDPENENKLIRFLISERVYGYPHTYGGRCSNYYYYVLYNHPILSIFFTHKLHPFSKKHRFIVFLCSLSFAVCFAFILLDTPLVPTFQVCRSVCNCMLVTDDSTGVNIGTGTGNKNVGSFGFSISANSTSTEETLCVGGVNDGRACSAYNDLCNSYESWMLSAACGAATVVYESVLHFLATCSCVQGRKRFQNNCCGSRVKMVVESLGGVTLSFFVLLGFTFTLFTLVYCYVNQFASELLLVLLLAELWSCVQWIVWALPWFLYKYPEDRRHFYDKLKRRSKKYGLPEDQMFLISTAVGKSVTLSDRNNGSTPDSTSQFSKGSLHQKQALQHRSDLGLNSTLDYDAINDSLADNVLLGIFGLQVVIQISILLILFLAAADTYLFRVGLLGMLVRTISVVLLIHPIYMALTIGVGAYRVRHLSGTGTLEELWKDDTFIAISFIQKLVAIPYYIANVRATIKLEDPMYFNKTAWINLIKQQKRLFEKD